MLPTTNSAQVAAPWEGLMGPHVCMRKHVSSLKESSEKRVNGGGMPQEPETITCTTTKVATSEYPYYAASCPKCGKCKLRKHYCPHCGQIPGPH